MSRSFDPFGDDSITLAPGGCINVAGGPLTVAFLLKPVSAFTGMIEGRKSSVTQWGIWGESGSYFTLPGGFSQGPAFTQNIWQVAGYSLLGDGSVPVYHRVDLEGANAGTYVHQNGTTTTANGSGPLDALVLGKGSIRPAKLLWAAAAVFDRYLNNADWVSLGYIAAQDWFDAGPVGMWQGNQASTSDHVLDATPNGGDQTATTNPAVSSDNPPGWDYTIVTDTSTGSGSQPRWVSATGHGRTVSERQFPRISSRTRGGRL